ncbi:hypothetical protein BVRB_3g054710 [Beta vulgaris subsp. vulgaris]|nr:hypothetical protein BVRB_3g054710 [Beta vulgaris subsp. vulgaris]
MKQHNLSFIPTVLSLFFTVLITQQVKAITTLNSTENQGNETDRAALWAIKTQLIDRRGVLSSWNHSIHHCNWEGITCGLTHNRVTVLDLHTKGLAGTISPFIGNLTFLRIIRLTNNSIYGHIPPEIGRLFRLESLYLFNNSLTGEIPSNISGCINLQLISMPYNNLQGKLPTEFGSLINLKWLWMYSNHFNGPLFDVIANLTSLELIDARFNEFSGTIPDTISRMTNLSWLGLSSNILTGTIPSSIFNLSSLMDLELSFNQLHGSIPADIAFTLPVLRFLQLSNNYFSGSLPISLTNLTSLQVIELSSNNFTGTVPLDFGNLYNLQILSLSDNNLVGDINFISSLVNCSTLEVLDLQSNYFTGILPQVIANLSTDLTWFGIDQNPISGEIPIGITNLINLRFIGMGRSELIGTIPQDIGKLQNLERLFVNSNKLSGEIPASLGNLSYLSKLSLDNNQFQGQIPASLGDCANLLYLYLSRNRFNGSLPNELFAKTHFVEFHLAQNQLEGSLPMEIGRQINIEYFDVSKNKFFGTIPTVFSSLTALQKLYMADNVFHGPIPPSFTSLKSLTEVDLSQNNLSGPFPEYFSSLHLIYLNLSYNNFEGRVPTKGVFANASAIGRGLIGNNRLCGGIPELHLPTCVENERKKRRVSRALKLAIIVTSAFLAVLAMVTWIWLYFTRHNRKTKLASSDELVKEPYLKVSYEMLLKATDGFRQENLLGSGSFGSVFKGTLDGKTVAVKVLNLQKRGGSKSFMAECEALKNIRHRNLVGILTACSSTDFQRNDFKALVYEFMPNGSLDRWLHECGNLSLLQRLDIAIDVAHALNYLHCECESSIVHCDLKPSNILIDHDMVAHVADFGLAKVLNQPLHPNQSSSIGIRGTVGYVAPEYGLGGEVSPEADLYSFGILLLELMTRKRPTDNMFKEDFNLHMYAKGALPDKVLQIVETTLLEPENEEPDNNEPINQATLQKRDECMISVVKIGVACSNQFPSKRMEISVAIRELQQAREILLNPRRRHNRARGREI